MPFHYPPPFPRGPGIWLAFVLCGALSAPAAAAEPAPQDEQVDYFIVVTGGELLEGQLADAHTQFIARTLRPLGLRCVGSLILDDEPADIKQALRFGAGRAPLTIVTGGLGPTQNDVTRRALADFTGIAVEENEEALKDMERRFNTPRDKLRANLRQQTRVPVRGTYLKNPQGTAVGLVFEMPERAIVALPGPPRELQPMVRDELVPYLNRRFGTHLPGCTLLVRFVGLGQSQIDQTLKEHATMPAGAHVNSAFEGSRVDFSFMLPTDTPQQRAKLQELKRQILACLGENVYATDETTLEEHVAGLLAARGEKLALAEVGSGGALAAALGGNERSRAALAGAFVGPSEESLRRLLRVPDDRWAAAAQGTQRADLLAAAAAEQTGGRWAIVVGEAAQDKSSRTVSVVFRGPDGKTETRPVALRGSGELARAGLVTQLLDQLRRRLGPRAPSP